MLTDMRQNAAWESGWEGQPRFRFLHRDKMSSDMPMEGPEVRDLSTMSPEDLGAEDENAVGSRAIDHADQNIAMSAPAEGVEGNEQDEEDHHDEVLAADREVVHEDREWERQWLEFLNRKKISHPLKIPSLCGKPLRPLLLFQEVLKHGGIKTCLKKKLMKHVVSSIQTGPSNENIRSTVHRMKRFYWRYLYDLELNHRNCEDEKEDGEDGLGFSPQKMKDEGNSNINGDMESNASEAKVKRCAKKPLFDELELEWSPERQEWMQKWKDHMKVSGQSCIVPYMAGRKLDIFQLYGIVTNMGGMDEVTKNRRWREVCRIMKLPESASGTLKYHYSRLLLRFYGTAHEVENEADALAEDSLLEDENWNDGMPDTNFLLQSCVNKSRKLKKDGKCLEQEVDKILCLIESLPGNKFSYSDELVELYAKSLDMADQSKGGQTLASFQAKLHEFEDFSNSMDRRTIELKKKVEKEVHEFQIGDGKKGQKWASDSSARNQDSEGSSKREMIPLFRDGPNLYCEGDCVILNSEGSDTPFIAQLLAYDRKNDCLHVRWLYKCEEVQKSNKSALYHYRKRHIPENDIAFTRSAWNAEHEVFFSLHMDRDVHRNSVIGLVTVYFTEGNPIDPHKYLRSGEYYCRAVWDPSEELVFHFSENDFKQSMRVAIDEELAYSPYPYPLTSSFSSIFGQVETGDMDSISSSMRYWHSNSEVKDEWLKEAGTKVREQILECADHRKYRRVEVKAIAKAFAMEEDLDDSSSSAEEENADKKASRLPHLGFTFDSIPSSHPVQPKHKTLARWKSLEDFEPSMCTDFELWHQTMRQMWNSMLERKGARREPTKVVRPPRPSSTFRRPVISEPQDVQLDSRWLELAASFDSKRMALTVDREALNELPPGWSLKIENPVFSPAGPLPVTSFTSPEGETFDSITALAQNFNKRAQDQAHKKLVSRSVSPFFKVHMSMKTTELYDGSLPEVRSVFESLTRPCQGDEEPLLGALDSLVNIVQNLNAQKKSLEGSCLDAQHLNEELLQRNRQLKECMSFPRTNFVFQERQSRTTCSKKQPEFHLKTLTCGRTIRVYHSPLSAEAAKERLASLKQRIIKGRTEAEIDLESFRRPSRPPENEQGIDCRKYPLVKQRLVEKRTVDSEGKDLEMRDEKSERNASAAAVDSDFIPLPAQSFGDKIRRRVFHDATSSYKTIEGKIVGVLPPDLSGFRDPRTGKPASLWRVRYDEGDLAEDLEFKELLEGIMAYRLATSPASVKEFIDKKILSDADQSEQHDWVGTRVRRAVLDENGKPLGFADGTIKQCISVPGASTETDGVRMFRVVYDIPEIGYEDLSEEETKQAIEAFLKLPDARADSFAHNGDLYVGRRIRRKGFVKLGVEQEQADGYVAEWLQSDLCRMGKRRKCSSCLWKVVYDNRALEFDYLNEFQVKEAIMIHDLAEGKRPEDGTDDWFTFGCKHIGKKVRRIVMIQESAAARKVDGTVRGWLPATVSNYFRNDDPNDPRALWRIKYDEEDIGEEDLELSELEEAIEIYQTDSIGTLNARERKQERKDLAGQRLSKSLVTPEGERIVDGTVTGLAPDDAGPADSDGKDGTMTLWRVKYDGDLGETDLDEAQVQMAIELFKKNSVKVEEVKPDVEEQQEQAEDSDTQEWHTTGSSYLGKMIRRSVTDSDGNNPMNCNAEVIAWLPANESNFFIDDDVTKPAALWRVRFQELGCADLEEHEVTSYLTASDLTSRTQIVEGLELYEKERQGSEDKDVETSHDARESAGEQREAERTNSSEDETQQDEEANKKSAAKRKNTSEGEESSEEKDAELAKRLRTE